RQRLEATIDRIERYLMPVAENVQFLSATLAQSKKVALDDDKGIDALMRGSLGGVSQIDALVFLRADLTSVIVLRHPNGAGIDSVSASLADKAYAHRLIEAARLAKGVVWRPVFYVRELGVSFLSAFAPVRQDGVFRGLVLATVPVGELSRRIVKNDSQGTV